MEARFYGRQGELEELARLVDGAGFVLVVGEPGIGKTALVAAEVKRRGTPSSWTVVDGLDAMPRERRAEVVGAARAPFIATSRELIAGWSGGVLRVGALDREAAEELWRGLDA